MMSWSADDDHVPAPRPPRPGRGMHERPAAWRRAARAAVRGAARAARGALYPEHALYQKLETAPWK